MKYKIVFSDFDGTLTDNKGHISPDFFKVFDELKRLNCPLVIVSGRSIAWGHFFLTHTPCEAVIMEGGGTLSLKVDDGLIEDRILTSKQDQEDLDQYYNQLLEKFPDLIVSSDSKGRITDRALEYYHLDESLQKNVCSFLDDSPLNYSLSNVHLNLWAGDISKFRAVQKYQKEFFENVSLQECVYFGDALNDESMFKSFENSVGVANIKRVLDQLKYKPSTILSGEDNAYVYGVVNFLKSIR